ncbi:ras and EF-hand domain-containing-like protein [Labeo rohita]|uniref:Ras and EF-hand domain-containing-like protein n=2 Tax=Euteleostomi TaxID=117571 RepID=A0A498L6W4_LABRO|nr:ras and EF-hand domain-containing-like protein [Labeo rohita]
MSSNRCAFEFEIGEDMGDPSLSRDCPLDCKVYVGNLGNSGNKTELERAFGYYGPLRSVWVARNPPGFAFVEFEDPRDATDAVRELDGSHDEPTTTDIPHEISDAVVEKEQGNNLCNVAAVACDTLTDLKSITEEDEDPQILATRENENMSDERGSETENAFEMTGQDDARDHSVTQIIMDVRDNEKDGETITETIWISHQTASEVSAEKEEKCREQVQYSSNISQTHSPPQDDAGKMPENDEVTNDKKETESTASDDVTSKSEEMFSFEDSATDTGSHTYQLFTQSPYKESYDLHERVSEKSEKKEIFFSVEAENASFDRGDMRSEGTEGIKEMDAAPVVILDVDTKDSESENPEQNRALTEEQTDTSSDTKLQVSQVLDNVSTVIDSGLLFHDVIDVSSGERERVPEKSDISSFIPHDSQDFYKPTTCHPESQENTGDPERVAVGGDTDLHLDIEAQNKTFDLTSEAEGTEKNMQDASVLAREVEVIADTVTVESNMTAELDFLQTSPDVHVEALNLSEKAEKEVSGETDTILKQSDINIIPEDSHGEESHSKSSPVIHKRKMGSTRRPLKGNKGRRKEMEHHDENETLDSEGMINIEKETFSLEDEPSPDESTLQSLKDEVKEQEVEISEENDVGPVEESESALLQSSCSSDLVSEESTTISICHVTESQDLTKMNEESQENPGDVERVQADLQSKIDLQNETFDITTSEVEGTEENIQDVSVTLVREVEVIGDTVTVESNLTTESDFLQISPDAHVEALKVSENAVKEVSGETDTILEHSHISIIPADSHGEETHSKSSPKVHKRKMGSTRRPLRGKKGQRQEHDEKEICSLGDEPSPDESTLRSSKDEVKEQEVEISEENDVGPVEGFESALLQSSCISDLVTEESTAISICHVTESQNLIKMNEESQENAGAAERVPAEEEKDLQLKIESQNKTFDLTTSEAEETEKNIQDVSVTLVREVEVIGDTVTVENNMTTESDFLQSSLDAHVEALKVSENAVKEVSGETDTIPEQSHISIIPADSHKEETHSKSSPVIHKRKMGSTRRPLKGNKGRRKEMEHHDENETLDSEGMINIEKEKIDLEDEPSPDESTLRSSKDEVKEQEVEISEENDVGPVEGFESALLQSSSSSDLVTEESTAISICHVTESQTLIKINEESQENAGAAERVPAEEDKDLRVKIEGTEENIQDVSVTLVSEVEVIGDTVTVENNMTTESDFLQTSLDAHMEALKLSENAKKEASGETDTIPEQSHISIIPEDSYGKEAHSKSSPVIHKRKMGSTRRPLKGNKGRRKEMEHHDENETLDSEGMINVEKETFSLEDEPSPDESTLQSSKNGAEEQEVEISEENDVGPVEGFKSALLQSSCISDLVSEKSTAISICHVTESQDLTKMNEESQKNPEDVERVQAELQLKIDLQNETFDITTSEVEGTEENIQDISVMLVREVEVIGDTVTVESNMTTESDFLQTSPDAHVEALKVSENAEKEVSGETDTILEQSDISIIPADSQREETHSKSSPKVHKRKMGSTRRPLKGNKGQRQEHDEKEICNLGDERSPDESTLQSSKDEVKEQEVEISEENDVGPVEGFESALLQSSCISDLVTEESTAISICHVTESQTLIKMNEESQENAGAAERVPAEEDKDLQLKIESQNKTFDLTTSEAEETEKNIQDVSVTLVREVEVIGDTVTVENMTTESDFLQSSLDAHVEALKVSENAVKEVSGETDTIPEQSHISIIPEDSYGEEAHSKSSPVIHKRKMGSTRRPLKGNKGRRKEMEHHDENETLDSEGMINIEKEKIDLEDEPSPDESTLRSSKDEVKEQEVEISEENDVGPVEGFKSALLQSSCISDLVTEESTAISICHVTESQTLIKINEESQENAGDAENVPAEEDKQLQIKINPQKQTFDLTTSEAEGTEENIQDISITLVREVEVIAVIGDTVTVESNMTTESDFLQTSSDANIEALKLSDNTEKEVSGETDTILEQSDISIIPADSHREETHSKSSPVIHKRKMGSTRRPLKGNKGRRKDHDEKEILEDEPCADLSGYTAVSICDISESQTLTKIHAGSQENTGDVEIVQAEEDKDLQLKIDSQNKTFDVTTSEAEGTEENIHDVSVTLVREAEVFGDTVTVETNMPTESDAHIEALKVFENAEKEISRETDKIPEQSDISIIPKDSHGEEAHSVDTLTLESNMTTESDFLQTSPDAHIEALQISENTEKEVSGEKDTIPEQCDISIIPADSHRQETHSKSSPVIHKRKMGSTRRPLRGKNEQRKEIEHRDENETFEFESVINVEKETFSLENEPSTYESTIQSSADKAKEQKIGIQEENDVGPVEGSESTDPQILCSSDVVSEETTAVSICHVTESQTITKMSEECQENAGEAERVAAEEDKDIQLKTDSQNKTFDLTTSETEENVQDVGVMLVREIEVTGDTDTVESKMTAEPDFLQTSPDAMEAVKVSENAEKVVSGETDTILEQSHINIIPADSHREETHSKSCPVIHKRKMGSTRRPLKGEKGQRKDHDEKEIFILEDEPNPNESRHTAVSICDISESQTLTKNYAGFQENTGEIAPAEGDTEPHIENKTCNLTAFEGEATKENIFEAGVVGKDIEFIGDTVVVESNMTTESDDLIQNDTFTEAKLEALKVSDNAEHEVLEETDATPKQSDTTIISEDTHGEEAHSKLHPVVHKRKMGSTRRPLRGKKGQREEVEHQDENETLNSEGMINAEKDTFSLKDEPSPDESTLQSLKDGAKEQMKISEKNDVGPVEESKSTDLQSSSSSDLVSEESTTISICHVTESQTLTKINEESQESTGDVERVAAEEDKDLQIKIDSQNKTFDITSEAEGTEENIQDVSMVLVREVEVIADTVTVETNMTTTSNFLQTSDAHDEAFKVSENTEKDVSGETDTIPEQSDISVIPADSHREETHSKSSPVIHKRKMGSTRRPLKGKTGRREDHDEKEIFNLKDEPSMGEEQMEIREGNDVGPVEGSEIFILEDEPNPDQSGYTAVSDISESQTLTKMKTVSQENTGEIAPAEEDTEPHLENKTFDSTAFEREATAENICEGSVVVREVAFIGDTVIAESNDTKSDTKVSDNGERAVSEETDATPKQSDTTIIPEDTPGEEAHSKLHPVVHKRKMGSTRRPLRGKKGQREEIEHQDKNEILDSEGGINAEKDTFSLKDEPSPDESTLQSTKDGEKEQMEISKKNDVGPVEGSESTDLQSSSSSDLVSEESTTISICHVTESQTLTKINKESQENTGDVERIAAEEDKDLQLKINLQNQMFDLTEAEGTEDFSVTSVREVEVIGDTVTVDSNMTTKSDFPQISPDANVEALKVSENAEKEVSGETDTILEQSHISIIPADSHREETHSKSSPVVPKRKMGSTRRPLKGNKGQRKDHDEKEILEDEPNKDESRYTAVSEISESQTLTKIHAGSQENIGDFEIVPAEEDKHLQLKIDSQNKMLDITTSEAQGTDENIHDVSVTSVREVEVIGDTVTVDSNMTTESDFLQTSDAHVEALKVPENTEKEVSGETDTIPEQSHINIIPADSHREETHSKSCPVIHKRKMGSTRRPLKGNKGQRKDCDEKEILEDEPNLDESRYTAVSDISESQTLTKIHAGSQENIGDFEITPAEGDTEPCIENKTFDSTAFKGEATEENICEDSVLGKEIEFIGDKVTVESNMTIKLDLLQNDTSTDAKPDALISEIAEISGETDTILEQSGISIIPADSHREETHSKSSPVVHKRKMGSTRRPLKGNKGRRKDHDEKEILEDEPCADLSGYTAVSICDISESQTLTKNHAGSQENTGDAERVEADLKLKIDSQNKTFDITSEAEGTEENIQDVSVTLVREVEVIGDTVTVDSNMTTESDFLQTSDAHVEALKVPENTEKEVSRETDTIPEQSHINIIPADSHREETHSKSSPVIHKRKMGSTRRPLKGNKGQRKDCDEKEILEDEPSLDESRYTAVSDISESQTVTKIHAGSQENIGDFEITPVEGDTEPHIENKTFDSTAFKGEATEENICEDSVLGKEIDFIGDTVVVESNMTTELDLLQNDTSTDAKPEALISEIAEISGKTDTILKQSDTNIIPEDPHGEKLHTEVSLNAHKRKMGSTRRPLRGNTGQRKVGVHFKEKNGDDEGVSEEEVTETHSEIQNQDNVVGHNVTQDIMYIRDNEDEEQKTMKTVDMSVLELCDALELKQRSDGPSQDDTVSHETQIHVSSDDIPPTKVVEMHSDSKRSTQKRKMGSTRKRGKRMVNEEEVEVEKEGEAENTTDDGTTKSEENLPIEEAITGSSVHQQLFSLYVNKESHDIQDIVSKSEISEQSDPSSTINPELLIESECSSKTAAEMVSDLPLGDVETYLVPKQSVIPKKSHREDQSDLNPVVQKRKMGSTRRTLRGNKGQGRQGEPQKMDRDIEEMTQEQDTEPYLSTSARKTESKFDEEVEQNFLVVASNLFPESENKVKEVGQNIHDLTEVSEENSMEHTGNDSNSVNEEINLFERTKDKFVLTVSHEDVHQTLSADYPDQHVRSEHEQMENIHHFIPTQELKNTQDDVVHENNSRKTPATQEKRRKMGSTRRNPRVMHGRNMADNEDVLGVAEDSQSKEVSSVSIPELKSEMLDLKVENLEPSRQTVPETPENTPQICDNQLVDADVTKHPQSETVSTEKRRKMGSTRKNLREGRIRGKRDGYEDTETADSEMSLVREDVGEQTIQDYSNQSEDSLLSEIEKALKKTSQSSPSCDWELIIKEPNPVDLANAPDLNMPENSEIKSLQPTPSAEPNSPGRRRRKMGSTRKNPRQQLKAETEDEDKVDREIDENLKTDMQEKKDFERVEVSVVHNITENKEYLDVSSAHTSSSQLEESTNPVSQEKTSPSTKRKFGSRRANKGKQGLGRPSPSDFGNESEDGDHKPNSTEVQDKLHSIDLTVCDPSCTLQPVSQPISHPVSEQRNMEAKNDEAASKGTGAGLVSLEQTIKHDRITGAKQTVLTPVYRLLLWLTKLLNYKFGTQQVKKVKIYGNIPFLKLYYDNVTQERAPDDAIMMLLGNKNDSVARQVQIQEGADLAREYNMHFMECSAATGANVSESMRTLAELLAQQRKSQKEKHASLRREAPQKKSGCC